MGDIKDYRDKELKLYALANIFVIIYVEKIITIEGLLNQNDKFTTLLVTIFNSALFLSILYIFVLLSDSLFSEGMKITCQTKGIINIDMKIRLGIKYITDIEIIRWYM